MKNLRTLVNDAYKEVLGDDPSKQIHSYLNTEIRHVLAEHMDKFMLAYLGVTNRSWGEWEIKEERFVNSLVGKWMLSNIEPEIIKVLKKVSLAPVAHMLEKMIKKKISEIIEYRIHEAVSEHVRGQIDQLIEKKMGPIIEAEFDKAIKERQDRKKAPKKPKAKKAPLLED